MYHRTRINSNDRNKIYICIILVLLCFIGIGYSIIQSNIKFRGKAKMKAYIPLAFANQTKSGIVSTEEQNISLTEPTGGSGDFIFDEKYEQNSADEPTNYFSLVGNKIVVAANTPKDTYSYVIAVTDNRRHQTIEATYTIRIKNDFANDSWSVIASNIKTDANYYDLGDTKDVVISGLGTHKVRIVNTKTDEECVNDTYSETACGVVFEFADIITQHRMNPYDPEDAAINGTTNGSGNKGGWEYSDMRAYLNNKSYLPDETYGIDYTSSGLFTKLPEDLQNAIIPTRVVSGYGQNDSSNFVTTNDKLYLLSRREVWNYTGPLDTASSNTKQLEYYNKLGVTESNYSGAIKKDSSNNANWWWLRGAYSNYYDNFYVVKSTGDVDRYASYSSGGVSPAFRIDSSAD